VKLLKTKIFLSLNLVIIGAGLLLLNVKIQAQEQPVFQASCLGPSAFQTSLNAKKGSYNVSADYVGAESTKYSGTISYIGPDGLCKNYEISNGVGKLEFAQDGFLLMELSVADPSTVSSIQIVLNDESLNNYSCKTTTYCSVVYQGYEMKLLPSKLTSIFDAVNIIQYSNFENTKTQTVNYAVDGKIAYNSSEIEPFDMNYVSSGEHALQTQIVFESGAVLLYEDKVENGTITDIYLNVRSWVFNNLIIFKYLGAFISFSIVVLLILWGIRKIRSRIMWSSTHNATSRWAKNSLKSGKILKNDSEDKFLIWYLIKKPLIITAAIFVSYIFVSNYIITIIKTDGISMMDTLQDNQQLAVNRMGRTQARINKNNYIPNRGDIVIVKKAHDISSAESIVEESLVVKRIIGIPGDRVMMSNGVLSVEYIENERPETLIETEEAWYKNVLKGQSYIDFNVKLGVGELFVVGDNRDNSIDSIFYGPVKADQILGEVIRGL
jgi:signal peptidase I